MQYNKSWKGQPQSCQCMLQEKEVWMWDKSDHMITANDEIFLKRKQPNRTNPLPERGGGRGWKMPTSKPKTFFFFFLVGGQMGSLDIMQYYSWKLNGSSIPQPPNVDTGDEKGCCLLSEAGVVGLNGENMSSWKNPSTSCPGQSA